MKFRAFSTVLITSLLLFSTCSSTPADLENPSKDIENTIEKENPVLRYSLAELRVNPGSDTLPVAKEILAKLLPGENHLIEVPHEGYYWSLKPEELKELKPLIYPLYLPDIYQVGDFWYLLLTTLQERGSVSREAFPLGENPEIENIPSVSKGAESTKQPLVILDPGHGGVDPGAVAANGRYEKFYNQRLAIQLKEELENRGFAVVYTHDIEKDEGKTLEGRVEFSKFYRQALFLSIHHNSSHNSSDRGFSVFFSSYSEEEESEEAYIMVNGEEMPFLKQNLNRNTIHLYYEEENSVKRLELPLHDPYADTFVRDKNITLRAQNSFEFALSIYDRLNRLSWLNPYSYNHRLIDERDYRVLNNNPNTSVIVECGFLSNPEEADLLNQEENVRALTQALADAVEIYSSSTGRVAALSLK